MRLGLGWLEAVRSMLEELAAADLIDVPEPDPARDFAVLRSAGGQMMDWG